MNKTKLTPQQFHAKVGNAIRQRRQDAGMTLDDVREKTGLSKAFLSELECGKRGISLAAFCVIADCIGMDRPFLDAPVKWRRSLKHD